MIIKKPPQGWLFHYGGLSKELNELFFLSIEVSEIINFHSPKPWDDVSFLTNLYVKKGYSLRRISRALGCNKSVVRKKLSEAGIEIIQQKADVDKALIRKVEMLRGQGMSYQKIADLFNLWRLKTISGKGGWHGKTVNGLKMRE